ncbi:hypothetical protein HDU99_003749, partial [Rhizoclosmatium hyalinum]
MLQASMSSATLFEQDSGSMVVNTIEVQVGVSGREGGEDSNYFWTFADFWDVVEAEVCSESERFVEDSDDEMPELVDWVDRSDYGMPMRRPRLVAEGFGQSRWVSAGSAEGDYEVTPWVQQYVAGLAKMVNLGVYREVRYVDSVLVY